MAKTKYKVDQLLQAGDVSGVVTEIRIRKDSVGYLIGEDQEISETDVTAVYRPVAPRATKTRTAKPRVKKQAAA